MALRRKPPIGNMRNVHSNGKTITGVTVNNENEVIQFDSGAEDILQLSLLRDRTIKHIRSQPLEITYWDEDGKQRSYIPDFFVERVDGSIEIHEFTLLMRKNSPKGIAREKGAKEYCSKMGWKYVTHTERDLPGKTHQDNLQALFGFCAFVYRQENVGNEINRILQAKGILLYRQLMDELTSHLGLSPRVISGALFYKIWIGELSTDLDQLIFIDGVPNPKMQLWLQD